MNLKKHLDSLVEKYQHSGFIDDDPVQFVHLFTDKRDIEITALLVSTIAWGRRPMILRNASRMLELLHNRPLWFVLHGNFDEIDPDVNIHRTFFGRHLLFYLRGLRELYREYGSLEDFATTVGSADSPLPAWHLAQQLREYIYCANRRHDYPIPTPDRCLPSDTRNSALKRFNMALRWLVRPASTGVDTGVWTCLGPSQLFVPLDVHVAVNARAMGLLTRRQNDCRAVVELTENLRKMCPEDPVKYDFALFAVTAGSKVGGQA